MTSKYRWLVFVSDFQSVDIFYLVIIYDDQVENIYRLKVANKDQQPHDIKIQVAGIENLKIAGKTAIVVEPGRVQQEIIRVIAPLIDGAPGTRPVRFSIISSQPGLEAISAESRFMVPGPSRKP